MTARDRWSITIKCPQCGKTGVARLWQEDGWSFSNGDQNTYVDETPDGFRAVSRALTRGSVIDFYCSACNVVARE